MTNGPDVRGLTRPRETAGVTRPRARWVTRVGLPVVILAGATGVLLYAARDAMRPAIEVRVAPVVGRVASAGEGSGRTGGVVVQAPGWVEPSPYAVVVPSLEDGVVREVLVLEGDRVEAGQVVARLFDEEARLRLRVAEARVAQRAADVERARAAVETARRQALAEKAVRDEAHDELARKRGLVEAGGVSAGEVRRLAMRVESLEKKAMAAEALVNEAQAAVAQSEAALQEAGVERAAAALRLERMEVRSPVPGVVLARLVAPGARVIAASTAEDAAGVVKVYDPAKLQVRVDVPLADAAKVGVGARATVTTEAIPGVEMEGVVVRVVHEANIQRNTVQFKVSLENPPELLKPEMLVRVRIRASGEGPSHGGQGGEELLVPEAAVTRTGEGKGWVWVVDVSGGEPTARRREVEFAGSDEAGYVAVVSGLRLTDRVVVEAPASIAEGVRVRASEAAR